MSTQPLRRVLDSILRSEAKKVFSVASSLQKDALLPSKYSDNGRSEHNDR